MTAVGRPEAASFKISRSARPAPTPMAPRSPVPDSWSPPESHHRPAIHRDRLAGDVAGCVGGEEDEQAGEFVGRADAPERNRGHRLALHLIHLDSPSGSGRLVELVDALGLNPTRRDDVDQDVVGPQFPGQRLGQAPDAGAQRVRGDQAGTGCLIDDEAMVRMRPPPAFFSSGAAACTSRMKLIRFCSNAWCHCASVIDRNGPDGGPPALCTTMSSPPSVATACPTRRTASSAELTSAAHRLHANAGGAANLRRRLVDASPDPGCRSPAPCPRGPGPWRWRNPVRGWPPAPARASLSA